MLADMIVGCRGDALDVLEACRGMSPDRVERILTPVIRSLDRYSRLCSEAQLDKNPVVEPFMESGFFDDEGFFDDKCFVVPRDLWLFLLALEFGAPMRRYFRFSQTPTWISDGDAPVRGRVIVKEVWEVCLSQAAARCYPLALYGLLLDSLHAASAISSTEAVVSKIAKFVNHMRYLCFDEYHFLGSFDVPELVRVLAIDVLSINSSSVDLTLGFDSAVGYMILYIQLLLAQQTPLIKRYSSAFGSLKPHYLDLKMTATGNGADEDMAECYNCYKALALCMIGDELSGLTVGAEAKPVCRRRYLPRVSGTPRELDAARWYLEALKTDSQTVIDLVPPEIKKQFERNNSLSSRSARM